MELLIVGLDGLSFNMLDRFDIELPYFDGVREAGVSGDLMSVDTPTTVPAWTSFATGKDPGTHGITNMVRLESDYSQHPNRPNTSDAAIYDFLSDAMFVNVPASVGRVPTAKDTHLVAAWLAEDKADAVPAELQELDAYDDYILNHDSTIRAIPSRYLDHVVEISEQRRNFACEAFEAYDPRVGFVLFSTPDWAGHLLSNLSSEEKRANFYRRLLTQVDNHTAELAADAENVVLMSDHGFEYKHTNVHVGDWLAHKGYFNETESPTTASDLAVHLGMAAAKRSDLIYKMLRRIHNHILGMSWGTSLQTAQRPDTDHERSQAWQLRYGTVYINDDRFDHPTVDDPDALRREIQEGLRNLTDEEGNDLFREVLLPGEAYTDPGKWVPDVIARPAQGHYPLRSWSPTGGYASSTENYEHRYRGIFVADGPLFESGTVSNMNIVDVLPTVLAALGKPVAPDFDGVARTDVLAADPEVSVLDYVDIPQPRLRDEADNRGAARDEVVEDRLEDLGYLE
jgi:predicted AlkP superfamily phosphohydrolase/phosphomutase